MVKSESQTFPLLLTREDIVSTPARRSGSNVTNDTLTPTSYSRLFDSEFVSEVKKKFDKAQTIWDEKVNDLKFAFDKIKHQLPREVGRVHTNGFDMVFEIILKLFAGQISGEDASVEIKFMFNRYDHEIEFFIPQLAVFLLYGSFKTSRVLQISILRLCEKSLSFSHKFFWFINAFSLSEAGVTVEGVTVLKQFLLLIQQHASMNHLSSSEEEKKRDDEESKNLSPCSPLLNQSQHGKYGSVTWESPTTSNYFTPYKHDFGRSETNQTPMRATSPKFRDESKSPLNFGVLQQSHVDFQKSVSFWNDLIAISRNVGTIHPSLRTTTLRDLLNQFVADNFYNSEVSEERPSVPLGSFKNKILSIKVDECFSFSTKDRAPLFICFEIVSYFKPVQKSSSFTAVITPSARPMVEDLFWTACEASSTSELKENKDFHPLDLEVSRLIYTSDLQFLF
jgi:hypothetical protein